jgi:hypothetical protein
MAVKCPHRPVSEGADDEPYHEKAFEHAEILQHIGPSFWSLSFKKTLIGEIVRFKPGGLKTFVLIDQALTLFTANVAPLSDNVVSDCCLSENNLGRKRRCLQAQPFIMAGPYN